MASSPDVARWVENRPTRGARALAPAELWRFRDLVWFLALRDVRARYKQALFGVSWALLQPLLGVAVFTVVFRGIADVPSDDLPYPVFALVGLAVWQYFSTTLNSATSSLVGNAALVTKVYFPRIAAPLASLVHGLVGLAVSLVVLAGMMAWYGVRPTAGLVALPALVLGLLAVTLGAGLVLATLNVRYRDVNHVFPLLVQLWLFASPVAYPASLVADAWRPVLFLNPMAGLVEGFRWALVGGPGPGAGLAISAAAGAALLAAGLWTFQRAERRFADVI